MKLYHGSPSKFNQFEINASYALSPLQNLAEGYGIYMLSKPDVSCDYKYMYEIDVANAHITDMSTRSGIINMLSQLSTKTGIFFNHYFDLEKFVAKILAGGIKVTDIGSAVAFMLEESEKFYSDNEKKCDGDILQLTEKFPEVYQTLLKPVIKYLDADYPTPVYVCKFNPEVLKIISVKENC